MKSTKQNNRPSRLFIDYDCFSMETSDENFFSLLIVVNASVKRIQKDNNEKITRPNYKKKVAYKKDTSLPIIELLTICDLGELD